MREKRISWNVFAQAVYTIALPIAFQNLLSTTASMEVVDNASDENNENTRRKATVVPIKIEYV